MKQRKRKLIRQARSGHCLFVCHLNGITIMHVGWRYFKELR